MFEGRLETTTDTAILRFDNEQHEFHLSLASHIAACRYNREQRVKAEVSDLDREIEDALNQVE